MLKAIRLRHLTIASWVIIVAGLLALAGAPLLDLSEAIQLAGLFLIVCGLVKLAVIWVWKNLAHMETDRHDPIPPV